MRQSRAEILDKVYGRAIARAKRTGSDQIRSVQVTTAAREIPYANVVGSPDDQVFATLALDIGFHADFKPEGSLGIMNMTPAESVIIAADMAVKSSTVEIGFMDRFKGSLIIIGSRANVVRAMEDVLKFFENTLHYKVCALHVQ